MSGKVDMSRDMLPCLDLLEATPGILRGLTCELSSEDAQWKPGPERFSVAEVLAHLAHSEWHCYRLRVDRFMTEELPELEPDKAGMYLDLYGGRDAGTELARFKEQREANLAYLRGLPASAGDRRALNKEAGQVTLAQMLHEWALHDLGHIRQIAELVRARRYLAGAGPLGESYRLKP
jgi:hypothetical protein